MQTKTALYREYQVAGRNQMDLGESGKPGVKDVAWPGAKVWIQTESLVCSHYFTGPELQLQLDKGTLAETGREVRAAIHPSGEVTLPPAQPEPQTVAELALEQATSDPTPPVELTWKMVKELGEKKGGEAILDAAVAGALTDKSINSLRRGLGSCDWASKDDLIGLLVKG